VNLVDDGTIIHSGSSSTPEKKKLLSQQMDFFRAR
jgi:hypothetical protein